MYSFARKALVNGISYQYGDDASKLPKHLIDRFLLAGLIVKSGSKTQSHSVVKVKPIVEKSENGWDVILEDNIVGTFKTKKEATAIAEVI